MLEQKVQTCVECDLPTDRCEEDSLYDESDNGPLCEACYDNAVNKAKAERLDDVITILDSSVAAVHAELKAAKNRQHNGLIAIFSRMLSMFNRAIKAAKGEADEG